MPSLTVPSITSSPGSTVPLVVQLRGNGTGLQAVQFDLSYDDAIGAPNTAAATATAGVTPICSLPAKAPGQIRCAAITFSGTLAPNVDFSVPFAVNAGASAGTSFAMNFSGVEFVLPGGNNVAGSAINGTFTVVVQAPAQFSAVPSAGAPIDFGAVVQNTTRQRSIVISNAAASGGADLVLGSCALSGSGFGFAPMPTLPATLVPAAAFTLTLEIAPTTLGALTGSLSCTHSATGSPATWTLSGTGVVDALLRDGFEGP